MIAAALLFLQVAAATPSLIVANATRSAAVPVVQGRAGPMVRAESLRPLLDVVVRRVTPNEFTVRVHGTEMLLEGGVSAVRVGEEVRPLVAAPEVRQGQLYLPLQFVSEVLPGLVPNLRWDADGSRLVVFTPNASAATTATTAATGTRAERPVVREAATRSRPQRVTRPASGRRADQRTVVVDAGHGGPDNGMTGPIGDGPRVREKDITLAVAMQVGEALRARGVNVVFTRTTDTLIALSDRGQIANRAEGDLFLSIHVNAANPTWRNPGAARGFETYFLAEARTEDARRVERMENEAVRFEGGPNPASGDPLSFILTDMAQNEHLRESSELAEIVQRSLGRIHPGPNRGVKQAGFRVLVTAFMPAVLIELGFGTNPDEARFMASAERQRQMAEAIADAAVQYLSEYERRVGGATP